MRYSLNRGLNFDSLTNIIFFVFSVLLLFLGFYKNIYNVSQDKRFKEFQKDSESLVIGRLIVSEKESIFYKGGLTGRIYDVPEGENKNLYQYKIYTNQLEFDINQFQTYNSQTGGQAIFYAVFDKLFSLENNLNLEIFWIITSLLTATIFSLFLLWVKKSFSLIPAIISLLLLLLSPWITVFGKNIWWSLWSFYLPFIFLLFYIHHNSLKGKFTSPKTVLIIAFITLFVKCFFTGFEYITTVCIMTLSPLIYYKIIQNWSFKEFIKKCIAVFIGIFSAVISSLLLLAYQISIAKGSLLVGFEHIFYSFGKRTIGNASEYPEIYKESLNSSFLSVLNIYLNGNAFDFNQFINFHFENILKVNFLGLIIILSGFSALLFKLINSANTSFISKNKGIALIITSWFSILAPLSWFIIFKGHSYIHPHMNFIVWYMPFCLFGFTIVGIVVFHYSKKILKTFLYKKQY